MLQRGLGLDYNYGAELEFEKVNLNRVYRALKNEIPLEYILYHRLYNPDYKSWYLDIDETVTNEINGNFYGGELSSRILTDVYSDWKELENVCHSLEEVGADITPNCSTHITVDISKYLSNPNFFKTLCQILVIYEIDMNLFFMGDKYLVRNRRDRYAKNIGCMLAKKLDKVDFSKDNYLDELIKTTNCFNKHDGISLKKILQGLVEIRYSNGTLDPNIIQNDTYFIFSFIDAIVSNKFPQDYLEYSVNSIKNDPYERLRYITYDEDEERFMELVDIIGLNSESKGNFLNQYEKVLTNRRKIGM